MFKEFGSRVYTALTLVTIAVITGIVGYMLIEGMSFLEAFYMTIITISTVGFGEVRTLSDEGKLFTIFLIAGNIGIFTYSITTISAYLFDGELRKIYKRIKVKNDISKLSNHVIICGYGRNGKQAANELESHKIPYVIIENKETTTKELIEAGILVIHGDATEDENLVSANIDTARALISCLPTDADNVFVVLTARRMNSKLQIISRATMDSSEQKLHTAGADNVIMPEKIGGAHMASLVSKPDIMEFIDIITGQGDTSIAVEEIAYDSLDKKYKNKTIRELDVRNKTGANIIGYKKPNGQYIINPDADMIINEKCKIIALGNIEEIESLRRIYMEH